MECWRGGASKAPAGRGDLIMRVYVAQRATALTEVGIAPVLVFEDQRWQSVQRVGALDVGAALLLFWWHPRH